MDIEIAMKMLLFVMDKRQTTSAELAARFNLSQRSVYRYLDELTCAGIPLDTARGRSGGIFLPDSYMLTRNMFTREEFSATLDAMGAMFAQTGNPPLQSAMKKLASKAKDHRADGALTGNFLIDCGTWGDEVKFAERLSAMERAIEERQVFAIDYVSRMGDETTREILPHLLIYKQNIWYVYAWCRLRGAFRLFKLGRMRTFAPTGEIFEPVPFKREDIPLNFWRSEKEYHAVFEVSADALPFAQEWLGVENVRTEADGRHIAEATLPDDEGLIGNILSVGAGFRVLAPDELRDRVAREIDLLSSAYRPSLPHSKSLRKQR